MAPMYCRLVGQIQIDWMDSRFGQSESDCRPRSKRYSAIQLVTNRFRVYH